MGEKEIVMFRIVDDSECRRYRQDCAKVLTQVRDTLRDEKDIITQFTLVGSGARNMVTKNGNGPFDLDYNLEITKAPNEYWNDLRKLKDTIRVLLDKASGLQCFTESQNSTVALTALLHFKDEPQIEFSFDVAIVARNQDGTLCRLVNNKHYFYSGIQGQYTWNEIPSSHNVKEKADRIKKSGKWLEVRERYVKLKDMYLSRQDKDHPSFIVYIEAVNQVFNKYFR